LPQQACPVAVATMSSSLAIANIDAVVVANTVIVTIANQTVPLQIPITTSQLLFLCSIIFYFWYNVQF